MLTPRWSKLPWTSVALSGVSQAGSAPGNGRQARQPRRDEARADRRPVVERRSSDRDQPTTATVTIAMTSVAVCASVSIGTPAQMNSILVIS